MPLNVPHGDSAPALLRIDILGPFVTYGGLGIEELPKKAQALLYYLIANRPRAIPRNEAAALLWSNVDESSSLHSLRQCVCVLRRWLPAAVAATLISNRQSIALQSSPLLECDLEVFAELSRSTSLQDLERAAALCRGDPLADLNIPHEPFDDWLINRRREHRSAQLELLQRLARAKREAGDLSGAIDVAHDLVAVDRYREENVVLLMELYAADGRRSAAIREYALLEQLLKNELGVAPSTRTRTAFDWVRSEPGDGKGDGPHPSPAIALRSRSDLRPRVIVAEFRDHRRKRGPFDLAAIASTEIAGALARDALLDVHAWNLPSIGLSEDRAEPHADSYLAYGNIVGSGRTARLIVQLVNRLTRRLHWSDHVDISPADEVVSKDLVWLHIAARLSRAVRTAELERVRAIPIEQLDVHRACLRATALLRQGRKGNAAAIAGLRHILKFNPDHALTHGLAARSFHVQRMMGWLAPDDDRLNEGIDHADAAVIDCSDPEALWLAGLAIMNIDGDLERGRRLIDRSLALNPASANAWTARCFLNAHSGQTGAAKADFAEAHRLDPADVSHHIQSNAAATAHFIAGDFEAAHIASEDCLAIRPGYTGSLRIKIATASLLGRNDEARRTARQLLAIEPKASIARMRDYWKAVAPNAPSALDAKIEGWRCAGMPA